jgi:hypothetical protein
MAQPHTITTLARRSTSVVSAGSLICAGGASTSTHETGKVEHPAIPAGNPAAWNYPLGRKHASRGLGLPQGPVSFGLDEARFIEIEGFFNGDKCDPGSFASRLSD